jgi:aryl-alcohol dehydrogenase-like predicted oxidoreductase
LNLNSYSSLVLGGSTFGWSSSASESKRILDFFTSYGGHVVDTSDFYSEWVPGNQGGESESILGQWIEKNKKRSEIEVITKVGILSTRQGFSASNIYTASNDSLRRLKTDYIDVYMPHRTPKYDEIEGFIEAFAKLFKSGKILSVGFSHCNFHDLQKIAPELGDQSVPVKYVEDNFNLLERENFKSTIPWTMRNEIEFIAARGLAGGFLTGKYKGLQENQYARIISGQLSHFLSSGPKAIRKGYRASLTSASVAPYLRQDWDDLFNVLEHIARERQTTVASIVLSWTLSQVGVSKTCVSFRTCRQLKSTRIFNLDYEEITKINDVLEKV